VVATVRSGRVRPAHRSGARRHSRWPGARRAFLGKAAVTRTASSRSRASQGQLFGGRGPGRPSVAEPPTSLLHFSALPRASSIACSRWRRALPERRHARRSPGTFRSSSGSMGTDSVAEKRCAALPRAPGSTSLRNDFAHRRCRNPCRLATFPGGSGRRAASGMAAPASDGRERSQEERQSQLCCHKPHVGTTSEDDPNPAAIAPPLSARPS